MKFIKYVKALTVCLALAQHIFAASSSNYGSHDEDREPRIVILGGGIAGANASYELSKLGYKPVIVEEDDHLGGKCRSPHVTVNGKDVVVDHAALMVFPHYREVKALCKRFKFKLNAMTVTSTNFPQGVSAWGLYSDSRKYAAFCAKYTKFIESDHVLGIGSDSTLFMSIGTWFTQNKLNNFKMLFDGVAQLSGGGSLDVIPCGVFMKFFPPQTIWKMGVSGMLPSFISKPLSYLPFIGSWFDGEPICTIEQGFQTLVENLANESRATILKNASVQSVQKSKDKFIVRIALKEEGSKDEKVVAQEFDKVILALPSKVIQSLETSDEFKPIQMLCQQIRNFPIVSGVVEFGRTLSKEAEAGVDEVSFGLGIATTAQPQIAIHGTRVNVVAVYPKDDKPEDDFILRVKSFSEKYDNSVVKVHDIKHWSNNFSHPSLEAVQRGHYETVERLQGQNGIFIVGELATASHTESVVRHAKHMVSTHFKKLTIR